MGTRESREIISVLIGRLVLKAIFPTKPRMAWSRTFARFFFFFDFNFETGTSACDTRSGRFLISRFVLSSHHNKDFKMLS